MKIAIIGAETNDSFESNLKEAFLFNGNICKIFDLNKDCIIWKGKIGHCVKTIDKLRRLYSDKYDKKVFLNLANKVNEWDPDLVICVYRFIHPIFVDLVKSTKRKVIHVNPDAFLTLGYQQVFASNYDIWFTKDPYMEKFMKNNMGLNVVRYNEAFNRRKHIKPDCSKDLCEKQVGIDVMTYGTFYPYRNRMLKCLLDAGIDLKIYGVVPNRFYDKSLEKANQHKYITGEEKAKLLYGSKIVFNNLHYAEIESVNCRFFEVNGVGAFQLCDYRPILKELLPFDPTLVSFNSINEGIEKIKYYLKHPEERFDLSEKIYSHFLEKYSYDNLIKFLLNVSLN